jgi:hypothetical protein
MGVQQGTAGPGTGVVVLSDSCVLHDLLDPRYAVGEQDREPLDLGEGWTRRWVTQWRAGKSDVSCPVQEMADVRLAECQPVRRFSWGTRQRHRPGLEMVTSTGRLHGFESLAEQKLLLALDFLGVSDLLGQPMTLRFSTSDGGTAEHVPDFLAVTRSGTLLADVRPAGRIGDRDRVKFAASAEAALSAGWGYVVVTGWRRQVRATLDGLSAQRRPLSDPLGIQDQLLAAAAGGPLPFGDLVSRADYPVIGRAHAIHLLWHRRLGLDLARPLGDGSAVWLAGDGAAR